MSLSEGILAAIIGAAAALITDAIAKPLWDKVARKSEERRWYLNYFLPQKLATLHSLHAAVIKVRYELDKWSEKARIFAELPSEKIDNMSADYITKLRDNFWENLGVGSGPFHQALSLAWIYLDEPTRKIMNEFSDEVLAQQIHISFRLLRDEDSIKPIPAPFNLEKLTPLYEAAQAQMEKILHPTEILERMKP